MYTNNTRTADWTEDRTLLISCDECTMQHTAACADCVVTFFCERPDRAAFVLDSAEQRAVRWFAEAGLVPTLRHCAASPA
jgi:Zn-finger protein